MTTPTLTAYCFAWHATTSPAFRHLLVEPLASFFRIEFVAPPDSVNDTGAPAPTGQPVIFCQRVPFRAWLAEPRARLVWIPMWDMVHNLPQTWWDALPKTLRVVAFSDAVAGRAQHAGLSTLHLRYAKNPADFPAVDWNGERTLMYWNRTGLLTPEALRRLCDATGIRRVLFRSQIDPYVPRRAAYRLPHRLGAAAVQRMPGFMSREDYLALLARTHCFVAPRSKEGVGMTFIEAMAGGSVVCAADAPAMNEYIDQGETGILLPFDRHAEESNARLYTFKRRSWRQRLGQRWRGPHFRHLIGASDIPVELIEGTDLRAAGAAARQSLGATYEQWQGRLTDYAQFILDW